MEFRIINEQTLPQVAKLWDYCFEKKATAFYEWYFNNYCLQQNTILGGFNANGQLETMLHLNPYTIVLRGRKLNLPYLVGVATAPVARGQHAFAPLLNTAFSIIRAQGSPFVLLMPLYAGVYQPYEFTFTYYKHLYKMPLAELAYGPVAEKATLEIIEDFSDFTAFSQVYKQAMTGFNGYVLRDERIWNNLLTVFQKEGGRIVLATEEGEATGYLFYQIEADTFKILELLATNTPTRNLLLKFAAQHRAQCQTFEWSAPNDDQTHQYFPNQNCTGSLQPFMMARVVDVQKALKLLPLPTAHLRGELVIFIIDESIGLNNTLLKVEVGESALTLKNTAQHPDLLMDVTAFTQLYFGQVSVQELIEAGRLTAIDNQVATLLDSILPKCKNYINEYY
ncbi:MAG: GNAT family N-acetyltransferase [Acidaminococcaceae bacterium]